MNAPALFNTISVTDFRAIGYQRPSLSMAERLQVWLAGKSRARLAAAERTLLRRRWFKNGDVDGGAVLSLDWVRGTPAGHVARLRAALDAGADTVVSIGALGATTNVEDMLVQIKRVLRPGGRLLFVEPVAARAGTRLRRLQGILGRAWRVVAGSATAPRDLWNDLKAAGWSRLEFDHVNLAGFGGVPVPHLIGEAVLRAEARPTVVPPQVSVSVSTSASASGVTGLSWREPDFAFFGR